MDTKGNRRVSKLNVEGSCNSAPNGPNDLKCMEGTFMLHFKVVNLFCLNLHDIRYFLEEMTWKPSQPSGTFFEFKWLSTSSVIWKWINPFQFQKRLKNCSIVFRHCGGHYNIKLGILSTFQGGSRSPPPPCQGGLRLLFWAWNFHFFCFEKFRVVVVGGVPMIIASA